MSVTSVFVYSADVTSGHMGPDVVVCLIVFAYDVLNTAGIAIVAMKAG